jgi:hypothetical protein
MSSRTIRAGLVGLLILFLLAWLPNLSARAGGAAQVPTGSVPTVTGTMMIASALILDNEQGQVFVRSGPNTVGYDQIGVLTPGQLVPVLGESPGGEWLQIAYPGVPGGVAWVWRRLVQVTPEAFLPTVEPPPSATPRVTATIDPTLAAQFLVEIPPTRLPTFTPAPVQSFPTFAPDAGSVTSGRLPMGLLVVGMAIVGLFGMLISFLRGR